MTNNKIQKDWKSGEAVIELRPEDFNKTPEEAWRSYFTKKKEEMAKLDMKKVIASIMSHD